MFFVVSSLKYAAFIMLQNLQRSAKWLIVYQNISEKNSMNPWSNHWEFKTVLEVQWDTQWNITAAAYAVKLDFGLLEYFTRPCSYSGSWIKDLCVPLPWPTCWAVAATITKRLHLPTYFTTHMTEGKKTKKVCSLLSRQFIHFQKCTKSLWDTTVVHLAQTNRPNRLFKSVRRAATDRSGFTKELSSHRRPTGRSPAGDTQTHTQTGIT